MKSTRRIQNVPGNDGRSTTSGGGGGQMRQVWKFFLVVGPGYRPNSSSSYISFFLASSSTYTSRVQTTKSTILRAFMKHFSKLFLFYHACKRQEYTNLSVYDQFLVVLTSTAIILQRRESSDVGFHNFIYPHQSHRLLLRGEISAEEDTMRIEKAFSLVNQDLSQYFIFMEYVMCAIVPRLNVLYTGGLSE